MHIFVMFPLRKQKKESMILKESCHEILSNFIQWKLQINSVKHKNKLLQGLKKVQTHTNEGTDGQAGRRLKRIAIVPFQSLI